LKNANGRALMLGATGGGFESHHQANGTVSVIDTNSIVRAFDAAVYME
jgi:hypothetical protein